MKDALNTLRFDAWNKLKVKMWNVGVSTPQIDIYINGESLI